LLLYAAYDKLKEDTVRKTSIQGEYIMKKLKDIFYDLNDILVALIIVAIAAAVIMVNINSILDYPSAVAAAAPATEEKTPTDYADNPPITNDPTSGAIDGNDEDAAADDQNTTGGGVTDQPGSETQGPDKYAVYINSGETGDQIADKLISVGLFKNRQEFRDAVTAAGAEGKLKAGNFIIPSDATPAEVIAILTK